MFSTETRDMDSKTDLKEIQRDGALKSVFSTETRYMNSKTELKERQEMES